MHAADVRTLKGNRQIEGKYQALKGIKRIQFDVIISTFT